MTAGTRTRGNAALDILVGRVPEYQFEPAPVIERLAAATAASQSTLVYLRSGTPSERAVPHFRISRPAPPRHVRLRPWMRYGAVLALLIGAAAAGRWWQQRDLAPTAPAVNVVESVEPIPTEVPEVVPTVEPTVAAPAPAPVIAPPPAIPVPANELRVLLDERFAFPTQPWPGSPDATVWRGAGAYRLRASQPTKFVGVGIPGTENLGDAVVTAAFHKTGGPAGGGYGLILRDQTPVARDGLNQGGRFYVFEVGDQGQYGVWLRDNDHWVDLLTWTPSDLIHEGTASNELTVTASGDTMSFFINGTPMVSQVDTLLHTGAVGLFTGGDGNEVAVEHVAIRAAR